MSPSESSRYYNWLGAMAALFFAVVLTWVWRFSSLPNPTGGAEMQAEEEVLESAARNPIAAPTGEILAEEQGLETSVVEQRLGLEINLSDFFLAQELYKAENGHYTTDIVASGWAPTEVLMKYKLGFLEASVPMSVDEITTRQSTDEFLTVNEPATDAPYLYSPDAQLINLGAYSSLCRRGCTADAQGFELMIAVPLDTQGKADIWLLDSDKQLIHVWDGIRGEPL